MLKTRWLITVSAFVYVLTFFLGCASHSRQSFPSSRKPLLPPALDLAQEREQRSDSVSLPVSTGTCSSNSNLFQLTSLRSLDDCTEYARSIHQAARNGAPRFDFPVVTNESVKECIRYFQAKREFMAKSLKRSGQYVPMMQVVFREHGLPEDLVYLCLIESGFNTHAYSRAKACGPWQFIQSTGRRYGLRRDIWVDERRDPEKATRAAAAYLKDLYEMFGDWYLAAAAYNAGENKIMRAIKYCRTTDYWEMRKKYYLKKETRDYVPKLMAAILIAKHPEEYGFGGIKQDQPTPFTAVEIPNPTELKFIARLASISESELKSYNPELRQWCTPARAGGYLIKVPQAKAQVFARNFERNKDKFLTASAFHKHRIRRGETLYEIARQYNTKVGHIQKMNGIRNPRLIHPGNVLIIPVPPIVSSS